MFCAGARRGGLGPLSAEDSDQENFQQIERVCMRSTEQWAKGEDSSPVFAPRFHSRDGI